MMKLITSFLFILLLTTALKSQDDTVALERGTVYPGYIITLKGDTVEGWLLNINLWLNQHITFFYDDPDNHEGRVKYKAKELKGYKVGNRVYESIRFPGEYSINRDNFFMRQITGPISYYQWYYDSDRGKLLPGDISVQDLSDAFIFEENELSTQDLCRISEGEMINLGNMKYLLNFDKNMSKLVSDYPELSQKIINKEEGYKWVDRMDIIRKYNEWYLKNH
ncbi:MAG: hypothetical protein JXN62_13830 [Bacteroidales bacterium]|nr:hypothetical protein [Bacteroidales bacterium]